MLDRLLAIVVVASAVIQMATNAFAQSGTLYPPNDPQLYRASCSFLDNYGTWIDEESSKTPARRAEFIKTASLFVGVEDNDLPKIFAGCRSLLTRMKTNNENREKYLEAQRNNRKRPDKNKVKEFEDGEKAAILNGIDDVKRQLSSNAWTRFDSYVNTVIRDSVRQMPPMKVPPPPPRRYPTKQ